MRKARWHWIALFALVALPASSLSQERLVSPPDPVQQAKLAQVQELLDQAYGLVRAGSVEAGLSMMQGACSVEATLSGFSSWARLQIARLYVSAGRDAEALDAYRHAFAWNATKRDLEAGFGNAVKFAMEYAILLAKNGRTEDAKAMYYYGLRNFAGGNRHIEPAPFLVVFDPDPEGVYWEYTPQRLEAAALMVQAATGGMFDSATKERTSSGQLIARVRELAPAWFYPVLYKAAQSWNNERGAEHLSQAEALARPGLEREVVALYRRQLAEHRALIDAADTPLAWDSRRMTEGVERRARMECLRPDEQVLRRISIDLPG